MPHIKVLTESQVKIGVQQAVIDRAARFVIDMLGTEDRRITFAGFQLEVKVQGEQIAVVIEADDKPFLCLYHAKGTVNDGKDWGIGFAAPDVWHRLPGLVATWQQKSRVQLFKERAVRRKSQFTHASILN